MSWPPVWEGTFVDPATPGVRDPAREAVYGRRIADEVHTLASARSLTPEQKDTICWVLFNMDQWASSLARDLRKCPWTPVDRLRGPMPPLKTEREQKRWKRYRGLLDALGACGLTRDAIVAGDWIEAISRAMQAGSLLSRDHAATGRVRGKALSDPNKRTVNAERLARRNALIFREAKRMRSDNRALKNSGIATLLAGKTIDGMKLPSAEMIRRILRRA